MRDAMRDVAKYFLTAIVTGWCRKKGFFREGTNERQLPLKYAGNAVRSTWLQKAAMHAIKLRSRGHSWGSLLSRSNYIFRSRPRVSSQFHSSRNTCIIESPSNESAARRLFFAPMAFPSCCYLGLSRRHHVRLSYNSFRFYSSNSDGSNASEGNHAPIKDAGKFDNVKSKKEDVLSDSKHNNEHDLGSMTSRSGSNPRCFLLKARRSLLFFSKMKVQS